jgi:hypothetical protein
LWGKVLAISQYLLIRYAGASCLDYALQAERLALLWGKVDFLDGVPLKPGEVKLGNVRDVFLDFGKVLGRSVQIEVYDRTNFFGNAMHGFIPYEGFDFEVEGYASDDLLGLLTVPLAAGEGN